MRCRQIHSCHSKENIFICQVTAIVKVEWPDKKNEHVGNKVNCSLSLTNIIFLGENRTRQTAWFLVFLIRGRAPFAILALCTSSSSSSPFLSHCGNRCIADTSYNDSCFYLLFCFLCAFFLWFPVTYSIHYYVRMNQMFLQKINSYILD